MRISKYLLHVAICLVGGLSLAGCKKGWIDINYNPIELTEVNATPDLILPNLLINSQSASDDEMLQNWMGYWASGELPTGLPMLTYYPMDNGHFVTASPDVNILIFEQNARRHKQPYYIGISKVLRALAWSRAVDQCNNMPYREAGNILIMKPAYDNGQFIYEDLIVQLDSAITYINDAAQDKAIKIGTADIMFHGNKPMWIRFINTLKLRLLMHQASRADRATYIKTEIDKIMVQGGGFLASGEDADMNPGYTSQKPARYFSKYSQYDLYNRYSIAYGNNYFANWQLARANVTAMNLLKDNNDPRLGFFYGPARVALPAGAPEPFTQPGPVEYRGNKLGLPINKLDFPYQGADFVSQVGGVRAMNAAVSPVSTGIIKGFDMDSWVMTSIESLFLQAEAIYRGWLPGNAEAAYKEAVRESFRWLNVGGNTTVPSLSDDAFNTWYTQEVAAGNQQVSWAAAPDKYKLLMFQKYMAFNGIEPFESYVDYRRNNSFPDIPLSYDPARVGNKMPVRAPYPVSEMQLNKEHVAAQGTIDIFTSKIWWMP